MMNFLTCFLLSALLPIASAFRTRGQLASLHSHKTASVNYVKFTTKDRQTHHHEHHARTHPTKTILAASLFDPTTLPPTASSTLINTPALFSVATTYLSLLLFYDRPRGTLPVQNALSAAPSRVPNAGLGLFVTTSLPEGTVLGTYPGVLRRQDDFYSVKCAQHPQAVYYSWRLNESGYVIDPTDVNGEIGSVCFGGSDLVSEWVFRTLLRFCAKSTDLARINEPPVGFGGCNVVAREEGDAVRFELCRDVEVGEELFMDYGLDYDRSGYGR